MSSRQRACLGAAVSVLEFIAALKWPITVLLLVGLAVWRTRRNPELAEYLKRFMAGRNVRVNIGGQELELSAAEAAVRTATQSDIELGEAAEEAATIGDAESTVPRDVTEIRREALETVLVEAAHWGWNMAEMGFQIPPKPEIAWDNADQPRILFTQENLSKEELQRAALRRRARKGVYLSDRELVELFGSRSEAMLNRRHRAQKNNEARDA